MSLTPSVTWAQRNNLIFLSINVPDVALPEIKVDLLSKLFSAPEEVLNIEPCNLHVPAGGEGFPVLQRGRRS